MPEPIVDPIVATVADLPVDVAAALADPAPGERIVIEADGIPFSTLAWGERTGRPLALLHGVSASAAIWWRVGPALAATGRRVLAPDLPGHGQTGHWTGRPAFRDMAATMATWIRAASLDVPELQVLGHSYGAMTAANLPAAGIRPASLVLLDPPVLPLSVIAHLLEEIGDMSIGSLRETMVAVAASEPAWVPGDVRANAEALVELDREAVRAIVLDNGDWDGGLGVLADQGQHGIDRWVIRGEPAFGGFVPDAAVPAFEALVGTGHVLTVKDGAHSPQRKHVEATLVAMLRALD